MVSAHYKAPRMTLGWGAISSVLFSMMILVSSMNPNSTGSHAPGGKPSVGGSVTGFGFRSLLSEIVGTKAPDASFGVSYIVLIDAGSSGSRVHVFSLSGGEGPLPDLHLPSKKLKVPAQELAGSLAHLSRNHLKPRRARILHPFASVFARILARGMMAAASLDATHHTKIKQIHPRGPGNCNDSRWPCRRNSVLQVEPGLSSFADRPSEAGQSLKELVDFVLKVIMIPFWYPMLSSPDKAMIRPNSRLPAALLTIRQRSAALGCSRRGTGGNKVCDCGDRWTSPAEREDRGKDFGVVRRLRALQGAIPGVKEPLKA